MDQWGCPLLALCGPQHKTVPMQIIAVLKLVTVNLIKLSKTIRKLSEQSTHGYLPMSQNNAKSTQAA
jgi:hypothetical protein